MRLFETTGVGTCLLTDWKENLSDLFDLNSEVVAFRSVQECSEKLRWLLADESARQAIAVGGQRRTLRDHTFAVRAAKLDDVVRHLLAAT
jgi:spore maturation protein CgeB